MNYRFFKKLWQQASNYKNDINTNEAICLQCDSGYIHLRKGLEKTRIEWTVTNEIPPNGVEEQI